MRRFLIDGLVWYAIIVGLPLLIREIFRGEKDDWYGEEKYEDSVNYKLEGKNDS